LQNRRQLPRVTFYAPQNVAASSLCVSSIVFKLCNIYAAEGLANYTDDFVLAVACGYVNSRKH